MSKGGHGTKWRRNVAENFNRLSRVHKRCRQTIDKRATDRTDRRTDGRQHIADVNMSARSLKIILWAARCVQEAHPQIFRDVR